ncbi:MAG TPA: formate dehydrogenase accessory sulfurtransferase FdhD [Planctomycetota bacterium]|nr:formate dehydrogenase accessory sulfurtransferase FdhD [Planctomycetota bacterium]
MSGRVPARRARASVPVVRLGERTRAARDDVVVEEPLEVRLGRETLLVTMRTPGRDLDLVRGLLFTEGLVSHPQDVAAVAHCVDVPRAARGNVVTVALRRGASLNRDGTLRVGLVSSACGVCGRAVVDSIGREVPVIAGGPTVTRAVLAGLPSALQVGQDLFRATGGLHAAGLFDARGRRLALAEDVGRHNAVDKVIGEAARFGRLPLSEAVLVVSGRAGFEIVHKARRAGIPILCSVSAPSSLAVRLAREGGQTLVGFLREGRCNVYCGAGRVEGGGGAATRAARRG